MTDFSAVNQEKFLKVCCDLDLVQIIPNINLIGAIFMMIRLICLE